MTKPALLVFAAGCITGLILGIATDDFRARAASDEKFACLDEPDRAAYYARRPGEAHTTETCVKVFRYNAPAWIPEFSHPLKGK